MLRRNFNLNVLLFNNEIYGLTKGQYSPTSERGKVTKSTPMGSVDHPFNPLALILGADGTFVARSMDRDPLHLRAILKRAHLHTGTSLVEIYQNCNVFNDGAFEVFTEKGTKADNALFAEHGKPLVFGANSDKAIVLDGFTPRVVSLNDCSENDAWIHDETDRTKAGILTRFFDDPRKDDAFPRPFGVFYVEQRDTYEDVMNRQLQEAVRLKGSGDLDALLRGNSTWEVLG
jgi:2-oxoglutarate ferredoxin oxidoreductase subunit beta